LRTFKAADGVVFPTDTGRLMVEELMDATGRGFTAVPCGVDQSYHLPPREQKPLGAYSMDKPFKWLYVSTLDLYKHQWHVVAAVGLLRRQGLPVSLDLVGVGTQEARRLLDAALEEWDPDGEYVRDLGTVPDVMDNYRTADAVVFASSCETPSFVLLESMAFGIPIACSGMSGMPEALGDGGEYFDPEDPESIAAALKKLMESPKRRWELASKAHERSKLFTWEQCAVDTLRIAAEAAPQASQKRRQ
jgi:glycosyltransferase involved in cell wall biosynthesis